MSRSNRGELHHIDCDWHLDQYPWECTCGLTAPRAPWFDSVEKRRKELDDLYEKSRAVKKDKR